MLPPRQRRKPRCGVTAVLALAAVTGAAQGGATGQQSGAGPQSGGAGPLALAQLLREHRYAEVVGQADRLLQTNPRAAEVLFYLGLAENGLGHQGKALDDLQRAVAIDPSMLKAAEAGAQIAYRQHDARVLPFLGDVVRAEPANPTAHAMLGVLALERSDCGVAMAEFAHAATLANGDAATTRRLALCRAKLEVDADDLAGAERELVALHTSAPQDLAISMDLADVFLQEKQPAQAVSVLLPLRDALPGSGLNLLAAAHAQTGDVTAAVTAYRDSIARTPEDDNSYLDLAMLSMEHQSPEVAMTVLDSGLKRNPGSARLLVARGTVYAQVGKDELAQKDFEQADRLAPNSTYGTLGLGVLLREDGNLDEAENVLQKKLKDTPGNPLLSFMLADVLVRKGAAPGEAAFASAEQFLHTALNAQPSLAPAHALLGKLLLKEGHAEPAIGELEAAIKLQPTDRTALNQLVAAYRRVGRTGDAERVSATLQASVATERAEENERNRIHLSVAGDAAAQPSAPLTIRALPVTAKP